MTKGVVQGNHGKSEHSVSHIADGPFFSVLTVDTDDIELVVHEFFNVVGEVEVDQAGADGVTEIVDLLVGLVLVLAGFFIERSDEFSVSEFLDRNFDDVLNGLGVRIGEVLETVNGERVTVNGSFTSTGFRNGKGVNELVVDDHFSWM